MSDNRPIWDFVTNKEDFEKNPGFVYVRFPMVDKLAPVTMCAVIRAAAKHGATNHA